MDECGSAATATVTSRRLAPGALDRVGQVPMVEPWQDGRPVCGIHDRTEL